MDVELEFLKTLVIIFGVSAFVVFILQKLKVPSVVGFLTAGGGTRASWICNRPEGSGGGTSCGSRCYPSPLRDRS